MADIFKLSDSKKPARKQDVLNLNVTMPNQVRYGERSLTVLGPKIWNNLTAHIKSALDLLFFKHLIKSWDGVSCKCNLCKKCKSTIQYKYPSKYHGLYRIVSQYQVVPSSKTVHFPKIANTCF